MAELTWQAQELVLHLDRVEQVEALHGELRFPASAVQHVEVLEDALSAVHGVRAPGTGFPGMVAVGTYRHDGGKSFAVIHHDTPRGVRVALQGADFTELIVGCTEPETVAARISTDTT